MISISISSYQVVNRGRKNVKIVVRARILPINYQMWPRIKEMNMMQKIIYDRKYDIFDRCFSIFGYFNLVIPHEDTYKIVKKRHSFDF